MLIYRFPLDRISLFREHERCISKRGTRVLNLMKLNIGNYLRAAKQRSPRNTPHTAYVIMNIKLSCSRYARKIPIISTYILLSRGKSLSRDIIDLSLFHFPSTFAAKFQ